MMETKQSTVVQKICQVSKHHLLLRMSLKLNLDTAAVDS